MGHAALFWVHGAEKEELTVIAGFAKELAVREWELVGPRQTVAQLAKEGMPLRPIDLQIGASVLEHPATSVPPEIITGLLSKPTDQNKLDRLGMQRIDLLCITLKDPSPERGARKIKDPDYLQRLLHEIDLGGCLLLQAAVRGRRLIATHYDQYMGIIQHIDNPAGGAARENRLLSNLAYEAERRAIEYSGTLGEIFARAAFGEKR